MVDQPGTTRIASWKDHYSMRLDADTVVETLKNLHDGLITSGKRAEPPLTVNHRASR